MCVKELVYLNELCILSYSELMAFFKYVINASCFITVKSKRLIMGFKPIIFAKHKHSFDKKIGTIQRCWLVS